MFSSVLSNNGQHVGVDHVVIRFHADGTADVNALDTFADGTITGSGTIPFDPTVAIPVVSGTGAYTGLSGTVTIVSKDNVHNDETVTLQ